MSGKMDQALIGTDTTEALELLELSRGVRHLLTELLAWSCAHDTDGRIPRAMLGRLTDEPDPEAAIEQLVTAGRMVPVDKGWDLVGFSDAQLTLDYKDKRRADSRKGQRMIRNHRAGLHTLCNPERCPDAPVNVDSTADSGAESAPSTLSSPSRKGRGEGRVVRRASRSRSDGATLAPANGAAGTPRLAVTPDDLRTLEAIAAGDRCSLCAQSLSAADAQSVERIGRLEALTMHATDCPPLEWGSAEPDDDGSTPPGWAMCAGGHLMPSALLVDLAGSPWCLASAELGCGGQSVAEHPPGKGGGAHEAA